MPVESMELLPLAILGMFIVVGATAALTVGLPWQLKSEAKLQFDAFDKRLKAVLEVCDKNAEQIGKLTTSVAVLEAIRKRG